ncbi:MAG TPA: hypothetical protein VHM89_03615 [Acidimicrobiales bacterium]|nr:hypothetical protein [Acidimicrobiales bacterium]
MAAKTNSFWTTTSGVVTGVAGTLTGVVGIATMAAQLGWIGSGSDHHESASPTTTTVASTDAMDSTGDQPGDATPASRASRSATTQSTAEPIYSVDPSEVRFRLGTRSASVTVRNTGTVDLDVSNIEVEGDGAGAFAVEDGACTSTTLDAGRSCDIAVTFDSSGAADATLVVEVDGAPAKEVPLAASLL